MFKDTKAFSSFSVQDIPETKRFYNETLGLEVSDMSEDMLQLKISGGNSIFVYSKPDHTPATFTVLNFPVSDVEKAVDDLNAKGVRFEIYDEEPIKTDEKGISKNAGMTVAWFKDPSGNILSVVNEM